MDSTIKVTKQIAIHTNGAIICTSSNLIFVCIYVSIVYNKWQILSLQLQTTLKQNLVAA